MVLWSLYKHTEPLGIPNTGDPALTDCVISILPPNLCICVFNGFVLVLSPSHSIRIQSANFNWNLTLVSKIPLCHCVFNIYALPAVLRANIRYVIIWSLAFIIIGSSCCLNSTQEPYNRLCNQAPWNDNIPDLAIKVCFEQVWQIAITICLFECLECHLYWSLTGINGYLALQPVYALKPGIGVINFIYAAVESEWEKSRLM